MGQVCSVVNIQYGKKTKIGLYHDGETKIVLYVKNTQYGKQNSCMYHEHSKWENKNRFLSKEHSVWVATSLMSQATSESIFQIV